MKHHSSMLVMALVGLIFATSPYGIRAQSKTDCGFSTEVTAAAVIEACTLLIGTDLSSADAYRWRAEAHLKRSDFTRALADYDKSIEIKTDDYTSILRANALLKRASLFADKKQYEEALADYSRVVESYPSWAGGYGVRGSVFMMKGDYQKALLDLNRAIELEPRYRTAYRLRSYTHKELGNYARFAADALKSESMPDFLVEMK
jgi:tetratricopeptide (TPR) repeat protein